MSLNGQPFLLYYDSNKGGSVVIKDIERLEVLKEIDKKLGQIIVLLKSKKVKGDKE